MISQKNHHHDEEKKKEKRTRRRDRRDDKGSSPPTIGVSPLPFPPLPFFSYLATTKEWLMRLKRRSSSSRLKNIEWKASLEKE